MLNPIDLADELEVAAARKELLFPLDGPTRVSRGLVLLQHRQAAMLRVAARALRGESVNPAAAREATEMFEAELVRHKALLDKYPDAEPDVRRRKIVAQMVVNKLKEVLNVTLHGTDPGEG